MQSGFQEFGRLLRVAPLYDLCRLLPKPRKTMLLPNISRCASKFILITSVVCPLVYAQADADKPMTEAVILSPFVITSETDAGYRSENTVSGTKTNTEIRKTPQSIQVINPAFISDQQSQVMADALRYTSGVTEGNNSRGDRFEMRGFTTGIPFRNGFRDTGRAPRDTANFDRIEVAKGPASVIMSRTSPGGAMNILSKLPQPKTGATVEAQFGSDSFKRAVFDATGPLGDGKLAYRLTGALQDSSSHVDLFYIERKFVSPIVTFQATDALKFVAEWEYLDDLRRPYDGILAFGTAPLNVGPETYYGETFAYNDVQTFTQRYEALYTQGSHFSARLAFRDNRTNEVGDVVNQTGVSSSGLLVNRRVSRQNNYVDNQYFQADFLFNFDTGNVRHNLLLGYEYGWNLTGGAVDRASLAAISVTNPQHGVAIPGTFAPFSNTQTATWYREYYVQEQAFFFEDRLTLLAGARFAAFDNRTDNFRTSNTTRDGGDAPNPRFGAVWLPRDGISLYVISSEIQVASTVSDPDGTTFDPVTSKLLESGIRLETSDKRFAFTFSYFDLVQNNVLQSDPNRVGFRLQSGESSSHGLEVDMTATPMKGWEILGAASFMKAEVTGDVNPARIGLRLANTPDRSFSFWNKYTLQSGLMKNLGLGIGVINVSDRVGDANNTFFLSSYTRVDLSLSYKHDRWMFDLNLRNALDEKYIEASSSRNAVRPGAPSNLLARIHYRF
jgi:iron complex outermembrane recepter protein